MAVSRASLGVESLGAGLRAVRATAQATAQQVTKTSVRELSTKAPSRLSTEGRIPPAKPPGIVPSEAATVRPGHGHHWVRTAVPPTEMDALVRQVREGIKYGPFESDIDRQTSRSGEVIVLRDFFQPTALSPQERVDIVNTCLLMPGDQPLEVGTAKPNVKKYPGMDYMSELVPDMVVMAQAHPEVTRREIRILVLPTEGSFLQGIKYAQTLLDAGYPVRLTMPQVVCGVYADANFGSPTRPMTADTVNDLFFKLAAAHLPGFLESLPPSQRDRLGVGVYASGAGTDAGLTSYAIDLQGKAGEFYGKLTPHNPVGFYPSTTFGPPDPAVWATYLLTAQKALAGTTKVELHLHREAGESDANNQARLATAVMVGSQLCQTPVFHVSPSTRAGGTRASVPGGKPGDANLDLVFKLCAEEVLHGELNEPELRYALQLARVVDWTLGHHLRPTVDPDALMRGFTLGRRVVDDARTQGAM